MNNKDAFDFLSSKSTIKEATDAFIDRFQLSQSEENLINKKFRNLRSERSTFRKNSDVTSWEDMLF